MNIEYLREFEELARQLNFTAAAHALHITQPALSNHVKSMEQETGVVLVERSAIGGARLTPAGQLFLEETQRMLALYDDLLPRLRSLQHETGGQVVVRTPRNEYSHPLLGYLHEFRTLHPHIDIVVLPWSDVDGFKDVATRTVDCAYIGYVNQDLPDARSAPEIGLVPYTRTEILVWVDKTHPLAQVEPLTLPDLDGHDILIPANKKHDSWHASVSNIIAKNGLHCAIKERYCDSLEDLMLSKVRTEDVMLCDYNLARTSSALRLRDERIVRRFTPTLVEPISLAYYGGDDLQPSNRAALDALVEFMRAKGEAAAEGPD